MKRIRAPLNLLWVQAVGHLFHPIRVRLQDDSRHTLSVLRREPLRTLWFLDKRTPSKNKGPAFAEPLNPLSVERLALAEWCSIVITESEHLYVQMGRAFVAALPALDPKAKYKSPYSREE